MYLRDLIGVEEKDIVKRIRTARRSIMLLEFHLLSRVLISDAYICVIISQRLEYIRVQTVVIVVYLEGILYKAEVEVLCALDFLLEDNVSGSNIAEVESHMEVRRTCTTLHIEYLHLVLRVILEYDLAVVEVFCKVCIYICC